MTPTDESVESPKPPPREPWSMKTVAIVIVMGIAVYTWLTLAFRKPEKANEPWTEQRARAELAALDKAAWSKSEVKFEAAVETPAPRGNVRNVPTPAVVTELHAITLDPWYMPIEVTEAMAPADWSAGQPYTVYLKLDLDTDRMQIGGFTIFRKDRDIVLVPVWEHIPDELTVRTRKASGRILFNAGDVPPGDYTVTVVAIKSCATWQLTVHGG